MAEREIADSLEKVSYALGLSVAGSLIKTGITNINPEHFVNGLIDTFQGEPPKISPEEANKIIEEFLTKSQGEHGLRNLESGLQFLTDNARQEEVTVLSSGLQYKIIEEGIGESPSLTDQVKCHYHGTLIDGTVFDSSVERGQPAVFPVNGVIQGWVEALQLMSVGSKWKLFVPPKLGYGERGAGGAIGPNSTLIFEVELLEII